VDTSGIITTIVGNGTAGFGGDNGPAIDASINYPWGIDIDSGGNLFISDTNNSRIRKIDSNSIITTIAGSSTAGFSEDGGYANVTPLNYQTDIIFDSSGNLFIADKYNNRIRKITSLILTTPGTQPTPAVGKPAYRPEVEIKSPKSGSTYAENVEIEYSVTDKNDISGPPEFGLGSDAVTIFYSDDGGAIWNRVARGLPPVGKYQWNIKDMPEGNNYLIKILAIDKSTERDEEISQPFSIDRTPPIFDVDVTPPFSKGENVVISITPSEPLKEAPKIMVKQRDYIDIEIYPREQDGIWQATYEVRKGFDGTAKITVSGKDTAGNTGNVIRKGGFFNVGLNPPPPPITESPLDNDVFDSQIATIKGSTREDTTVTLILNGDEIKTVSPKKDGTFIIEEVKLSKTFNRGVNILQLIAKDASGSLSEPAVLNLKFNTSPVLKIIEPQAGAVLSATTTIKISARDENSDKLSFLIEYSNNDGESWQELIRDIASPAFIWETRDFPDGEYLLRVTASDGYKDVVVLSQKFFVKNFLPIISFVKERIIVNEPSAVIEGIAETPDKPGERAVISSIEYSTDNKKSWNKATAKDGSFGESKEEFQIVLSGMKEDFYDVFVRAVDESGLVGKSRMQLIVDFGPPPAPTITHPRDGYVFSDQNDENIDEAGIQISIKGSAEKNNKVVVINNNIRYVGASDDNGEFDVAITIREKGENLISAHSIDPAGNKSTDEDRISIRYNNPPSLKFLRPYKNGGLNHKYEIVFEIQDKDLDKIQSSSLSYSKAGASASTLLAKNLTGGTFVWDVSDFTEGYYDLILRASDGVSENTLTRRVVIDNTRPTTKFEQLKETAFAKAFTLEIKGSAQDNFSGIEYVEYSIDSENWYKAIITKGYGARSASFRVSHPFELKDGEYDLVFRATDVSGNTSAITDSQKIIIDTTPPRIGSQGLYFGSLMVFPDEYTYSVSQDSKLKFITSLEKDVKSANLKVGERLLDLSKKLGLWESEISFPDLGEFTLLISAEDYLGNKTTDKNIGGIKVIDSGSVITFESGEERGLNDVDMEVFVFDQQSSSWSLWEASPYDLENPISTKDDGAYSLFLPEGRYRLHLQKTGFQRLRSSDFDLSYPRFIDFNFMMKPREGVRGIIENIIEKLTF